MVLDFTKCNHLDVTATTQLKQFMAELKLYGGKDVELRFTGMSEYLRTRMARAKITVLDDDEPVDEKTKDAPRHFRSLAQAVYTPRRGASHAGLDAESIDEKKGAAVEAVEKIERVEDKV